MYWLADIALSDIRLTEKLLDSGDLLLYYLSYNVKLLQAVDIPTVCKEIFSLPHVDWDY